MRKKIFKIAIALILMLGVPESLKAQVAGGNYCPPQQCQNCVTITFEQDPNLNCQFYYYWQFTGSPTCGDLFAWETTLGTTTVTAPCLSCYDGPCRCPKRLILSSGPINNAVQLNVTDITDPSTFPPGPYPYVITQTVFVPNCGGGITVTIEITVTGPLTANFKIM